MLQKSLFVAAALAVAATVQGQRVWQVVDGAAIIEAEYADQLSDSFQVFNEVGGFKGTGYVEYRGVPRAGWILDGLPAGVTTMKYHVNVTEPGVYVLKFRGRKDGPLTGDRNDIFVRRDNGTWIKHFLVGDQPGDIGVWKSETWAETSHHVPVINDTYTLLPGIHTIEIFGREPEFKLDRIYLLKQGMSANDLVNRNDTSGAESLPAGARNFRNGDTRGFVPISIPALAAPYFQAHETGLMMYANERAEGQGTVFGFWEHYFEDVRVSAGERYEVTVGLTSSASPEQRAEVPTFRLRVFDETFRSTALLNVESTGDGSSVPVSGESHSYTVQFTVPKGVSGARLGVALDYLWTSDSGNNPYISIQAQSLTVTKK